MAEWGLRRGKSRTKRVEKRGKRERKRKDLHFSVLGCGVFNQVHKTGISALAYESEI